MFGAVQNILQQNRGAPSSSFLNTVRSQIQQRQAPKPATTAPAAPAQPAAARPAPTGFASIWQRLRGMQRPPAQATPAAPAPAAPAQPATPPPVGGPSIAPTVPPQDLIAPTAPSAPAPPPAQPGSGTQAYGATIRDITGGERPQAITPSGSVTDPLQERAQAEAMRALENPSAFDDDLFKAEVSRARESFDADIANRGLDYSTIAPQLFGERVLNPLLSERARTISADRARALQGAQGVIGQRAGLEGMGREELRGERSYTDSLREQARRNAIEEYQLGEGQFQQTLQQALASGDPSRALAALQSAAYGMGSPAAAYGDQAEQSGAGLQDLAQLFIEQFYGNKGAQQ